MGIASTNASPGSSAARGSQPVIETEIPNQPPIELVAYYEEKKEGYRGSDMHIKGWFVGNIEKDWIIFDCGAHIGYLSILFSRCAPEGHIYAFEPTSTYDMLLKNLRHNAVPNVTPLKLALGKQSGLREDRIYRIWGNEPDRETYDFAAIDDFVNDKQIPRVDCIKIDVDSFDFEVLQGAKNTLLKYDPYVIVELNHALWARKQRNTEALEWLARLGYKECVVLGYDNFLLKQSLQFPANRTNRITLHFNQQEPLGLARCSLDSRPDEQALLDIAEFDSPRREEANHREPLIERKRKGAERASPGENPVKSFMSPAKAYWNQRSVLRRLKENIRVLSEAVASQSDLSPVQWAQLMAFAIEFKPDLILELGRRRGNSTCAFTESANFLKAHGHRCRILSLCLSDDWDEVTRPRLLRVVPEEWFSPLQALKGDILTFDYRVVLADVDRCLVFWDAHGYDVAECVLGGILPQLVGRDHYVIMHDLSDARYAPAENARYGKNRLWKGNNWSGSRLRLGHMDTAVEQGVAMVDFTSRNRIPLRSADNSLHTEMEGDREKLAEMKKVVGEDLFSLCAHWFWFTLNEAEGPLTFPVFDSERYRSFQKDECPDQVAVFRKALESASLSRPDVVNVIQRINGYLRKGQVSLALKILKSELGNLPGASGILSRLDSP